MNQENTFISFIGQKISKVSWCEDCNGGVSTREFYTATEGELCNQVSRWVLPDDGDNLPSSEPETTCCVSSEGSVTDLIQLSSSLVGYSSDNGDVVIASYDPSNQSLQERKSWKSLHKYEVGGENASCTCLAYVDGEIVSGGEDGSINVLLLDQNKPISTIKNADSSNITGLEFLSNREILSINTTGQLKLWDIRSNNIKFPEKVMSLSGSTCPILSLDKHPNQNHIIVTGHRDGVIGIWDIRQDQSPVTLIDAHEAEVWQVRFHSLFPDNLFTCSQDGSCWFWDGTSMLSSATLFQSIEKEVGSSLQVNDNNGSSSMWLYIDANKHKMETFSLLPFNTSPINCFDIHKNKLICATDNDALIIVQDIPVHS